MQLHVQTVAIARKAIEILLTGTGIRFVVPRAERVEIRVFNTLEQQIRTLVRGEMEPGVHDVRWDGRDDQGRVVSGGVYFYRLQAGSFSEVKKMSFLR